MVPATSCVLEILTGATADLNFELTPIDVRSTDDANEYLFVLRIITVVVSMQGLINLTAAMVSGLFGGENLGPLGF